MRFFVALFLILFVSEAVYSQVRFNSLAELLQYADTHAPVALQASALPKVSKQDVNIQASSLFPKVNAFGTGDYYPIIATQVIPGEIVNQPGTYVKAQFGLPYIFMGGAELSMPIVNMEKWAQLSKANAAYSQAKWTSKQAVEFFHIMLMQSYYQYLVTKEVLILNNENGETATELDRIVQARNKSGVINPADLNRTKNLTLDVQVSDIGYKKQLDVTKSTIDSMLDIKTDSGSFAENIRTFNWPLLEQANNPLSRSGWQEADYKLKAAEYAFRENRNAAFPKLSLSGRYWYTMQSKLESANSNVDFNTATVGARLDFPIFQGNYYRSLKNKSKLQLQIAKLENERIHSSLIAQQDIWFNQYRAAFAKHAILDEKVRNASDNLRIAKLNIKEGLMEFDQFNNIFLEYNRARMEQLQNLADGILYYLLSTQNF